MFQYAFHALYLLLCLACASLHVPTRVRHGQVVTSSASKNIDNDVVRYVKVGHTFSEHRNLLEAGNAVGLQHRYHMSSTTRHPSRTLRIAAEKSRCA